MILQVNNPPLLWLWNLGSQILQGTERTFTSNTQATLQSSTGVLAESSGQGLQLFSPLAVKTHTQRQNTVVDSPFNLFYFAREKKVNWFILTSNKSHFQALKLNKTANMNWAQWFASHSQPISLASCMNISVNLISTCFSQVYILCLLSHQPPLESTLYKKKKKASVYSFSKHFIKQSNELIQVMQFSLTQCLAHTKCPCL